MLKRLGGRVWMRLRRWYRRNAHMLGLVDDRRVARARRPARRSRSRIAPGESVTRRGTTSAGLVPWGDWVRPA